MPSGLTKLKEIVMKAAEVQAVGGKIKECSRVA